MGEKRGLPAAWLPAQEESDGGRTMLESRGRAGRAGRQRRGTRRRTSNALIIQSILVFNFSFSQQRLVSVVLTVRWGVA